MALTYLLLTVLLAGVVNGQLDDEEEHEGYSPDWEYDYVPALPLPPVPRHHFRGLPQPPKLPSPPPLLIPRFAHFPKFPSFPDIPPPKFPTFEDSFPNFPQPEDPTNEEFPTESPKPGGTFEEFYAKSHSEGRREDGKIKWKGGSTVINNDNGNITEEKYGDSPPEVNNTKVPAFPDFPLKFQQPRDPFDSPLFGHHHHGGFPSFKFDVPKFDVPKFDVPKFDAKFVPKEGQHYQGSSVTIHKSSSNVNGQKSSSGSYSATSNIDGVVDEEKKAYKTSDPNPE